MKSSKISKSGKMQTTNGPIKIDDWSIKPVGLVDFCVPELNSIRVVGRVYNSPSLIDGTFMSTSRVVEMKTRKIWTQNGTKYTFGKINAEYRKWLKNNYPNWNWRNPIKPKN